MPELYAKQLAALDELKKSDPNLDIAWDEETGAPFFIRGQLSAPALPIGAQSMEDAAQQAALAFLKQYKDLYRLRDPEEEFGKMRVVGDEIGKTVRLYQSHQGVEVYDGEISVALDQENRVTQVLGRYRPLLRLSTEPKVSAEEATQVALHDLETADKQDLAPITHRLLILNTGSFPDIAPKLGKVNHLVWRIEILVWVYFVDARDGSILFKYDNTQDARNRKTYNTFNCRALPGTLWIAEDGPVPGQPVDEIAWAAHNHAGTVYDYYRERWGLDSFDGRGYPMVSTVHGGVPSTFGCTQNNAAFIPSLYQIVYGDGDGEQFGPFCRALDVVAHEWQHAVTYFAITWDDGSPRGLDYRDQSGALNESYSDFFGALVENKNWALGEDCYTPKIPNDALRDMQDPTRYGQPDHYSKYSDSGTQGWKVHHNSGIMNKCAYLMVEGGTHFGVTVQGMGKEAAARVWYRALTHHLHGASTFREARLAMLQACQELFPGDVARYATVQNACAAVGLGDPAPPPSIVVAPTQIDFGTVLIGQSAERTATVRNQGTQALNVSARCSDPAFSVTGSSAFELATGASRELTVRFAPTAPGAQQASLTIECSDATQPAVVVALSGAGLGVPSIALEPAQLDFGSVTLGESAERTVNVRNTGSAELAVSAVRSSDAAFSVVGDTAFQLAPGVSQALTVRFSPAAVGEKQGTLTIESNDSAKPTANIAMSGTALGIPSITVEPMAIDFGKVTIGDPAERALTVRNSGTAVLVVSAVRSSSPAFVAVGNTAFELAPAATRTLTLRFAPTSVGAQEATLTIESNDAKQPALAVTSSGTGLGAPTIAVEPAQLDFGTVTLGQSAERDLTIRNDGTDELAVYSVQSNHAAFSVVGDSTFKLAPQASKTLTVRFVPTSLGERQASLTVQSSDSKLPTFVVSVSGIGFGMPAIVVEPAAIDLGSVPLGQSAQRALTVRKSGSDDLHVSAVQSSDPSFSVVGDTAFQLAAGASKELTVQFSPTRVGAQQATLTIQSNDTNHPTVNVALSGTALGVPGIAVEPTELDFGTLPLGQSTERTCTVRNDGTADLSVSAVRSSDPAFSLADETAFDLAAGASKTLSIRFSPTAAGPHRATLTIESNDASRPTVTVALSGTAQGVPGISVKPAEIDFGTLVLGQSAERVLTVRNAGSADLSVSSVKSHDPTFAVLGETAFVLAPGASTRLTIRFLPTTVGQRQVNLTIESNDSEQPTVTVALSGRVVGVSSIVVDPTSIDFGTLVLGQSAEETLTVRNTGSADLGVSNVESSNPAFTVIGDQAFQLEPAAFKKVGIRFAPTAAGHEQASLNIESNDSSRPTVTIPLSGSGVTPPAIAVEPPALDFASVVVGESAALSLTLANTGGSVLHVAGMQCDAPAFEVMGQTSFEVEPETARAVMVRFAPAAEGPAEGTLSIACDDPRLPTLRVQLKGSGEPELAEGPHIVLEPRQLNFGSVPIGQAPRMNVTVKNHGQAPLAVRDVSLPLTVFSIMGETAFEVAPSAARKVTILYRPSVAGAHSTRVTFSCNDPEQPEAAIPVFGTGTRCLVSTAAYGSPVQKDVRTLRAFRDESLLNSSLGRNLVAWYYRLNDTAADLIAHSQAGRTVVRWMLRPLIALARRFTKPEQE